jgi:hypothetical protein
MARTSTSRNSNGQISTSQEFNRTAAPNINGSGYHPLDINKDGQVNVADIVTANNKGLPTIVSEMIMKYYQNENPYDLDNDGLVTDNDISIALSLGVPANIIKDMRDNKDTVATITNPTEPEPYIEENLVARSGQFRLLNGMDWTGPYHCYHNGDIKIYKTEASPIFTYSRLLLQVDTNKGY